MSLFGSLQIASNSLRATQIGLQVVGQNIANANTPGYIRESVSYSPAPTQRLGSLSLGLGVQVDGVVQKIDNLLEQRLRNATSDRANADALLQTYQQLEGLTNELGNDGLGKSMSDFFSSIDDVLNQPEDVSVRNLTVLQGQNLASAINRLNSRGDEVRNDLTKQISSGVDDINRLVQTVADLNVQISRAEGGNSLKSAAVGLRDQRNLALGALSELVDINVQEQPNGSVSVYTAGDFLVLGDETRKVKLGQTDKGEQLQLVNNGATLQASSGKVISLINARDQVIGGFQKKLDSLANTLAFEFNKIHSSGQGLSGYQKVTSFNSVFDANQPLDSAGLLNTPVNGSFVLQLFDKTTGTASSTNISVDLNGLDHDTTLNDLVAQINSVDGVTASVDSTGHLTIQSNSSDHSVAFSNDTSGFLAAIGINTFFTGTNARSLAVNQAIASDPSKFAASSGGVGENTGNAVKLAGFLDQSLESQNGNSVGQMHDQIINETTQGSAQSQSVATGLRMFESSLQGQSLAISGVNIDEETITMLSLQRSYQASAKFIAAINDLMGVLINL